MTLLRSIAVVLLATLLAVGAHADTSPTSTGGGGDNGGSSGGSPGGPGPDERRQPRPGGRAQRQGSPKHRSQDGTYNLTVSGYYKGTGTASVSPTTVTITANVLDANGASFTFTADALTIDGPYFSGNGTIGDSKVTVKGGLDAAESSRLLATYTSADGHRGRIVGTLPTDAGDPKWNDDKGH